MSIPRAMVAGVGLSLLPVAVVMSFARVPVEGLAHLLARPDDERLHPERLTAQQRTLVQDWLDER
jgi:hypothetical protein